MCFLSGKTYLFNDSSFITKIFFIYFIEREIDEICQCSIPNNSRRAEGINFAVTRNHLYLASWEVIALPIGPVGYLTTKFRVLFVGDRSSKKLRNHLTFIMLPLQTNPHNSQRIC